MKVKKKKNRSGTRSCLRQMLNMLISQQKIPVFDLLFRAYGSEKDPPHVLIYWRPPATTTLGVSAFRTLPLQRQQDCQSHVNQSVKLGSSQPKPARNLHKEPAAWYERRTRFFCWPQTIRRSMRQFITITSVQAENPPKRLFQEFQNILSSPTTDLLRWKHL